MLQQLTPVLFVDEIGTQLDFWVEKLGFQQTVGVAETPEQEISAVNPLGFVILQRDAVQVMLQTWASIQKDIGWCERSAQSFLYIKVEHLEEIERCLSDYPLLFPKRQTFYGAWEVGVRDPAGNLVVFAQFSPDGEESA